MQFREIEGYESVKADLRHMAQSGRIPHNLLFEMEDGMPGVALGLAFFQYLNCTRRDEEDSCGVCPNCRRIRSLTYPELFFVYPVVKAADAVNPSELYFEAWHSMLLEKGELFDHSDWLEALQAGNSQPIIYAKDAAFIEDKLSRTISAGSWRAIVIYEPERMSKDASNKLLKLMEEPPQGSLFISVSFHTERLLPTVLSRMQRIELLPESPLAVAESLRRRYPNASEASIERAVRRSDGILTRAVKQMELSGSAPEFFLSYKSLIDALFQRKVAVMKQLADTMAAKGREWVIAALEYMEDGFRYAFRSEVSEGTDDAEMTREEQSVALSLKGVITADTVAEAFELIEKAIYHIKGNVFTKVALFDTFMKLTSLLTPAIKMKQLR